ncbi:RHS repeat-associated core domain-containing protein [Pseudomonas sp. NPDC087697]|uniref:RHS repeat-associated core domain-containing protein n=1 Tax=Pseudomonas sp. NPDC087697 TaxID=3364447 RepID=UPI003800EF88
MSLQVHRHTPTLKVNDSRGLPVRQVEYLRKKVGTTAQTLVTRQIHDADGRLIAQWDPRLFGNAPRPNLATVYRLSGEALRVDSVDSGRRLSLAGLAGEVLQRWDQRANHWRTTYDNQLRVIAVEENAQPNVETFTYADASADPKYNRRGQMLEQIDRAGVLSFSGFSLHGQTLSETRTFPDNNHYTSSRHYSANGALLTQTDAAGHRQHTRYDIAGQLKQVRLQLDADSPRQDILSDTQYNAAGQIVEQRAGNGVISTWGYDPIDGRLHTLKAGKPGKPLCQNLEYVHDRVGNVLRIEDHTLSTVFFANQRVDSHREFAYDSLYRLTWASGFEAEKPNLQPGLPDLITPIDPGRRFNYTEHYDYDQGNNLTTLCHRRDGNNFTRQMRIDEHSNRGVRWEEDDPEPIFDERFDPHGNQLLLQRGQPLSWNPRDQLAKVTLLEHSNGLPDDEETYLYSQGMRVYKHHVWHTPSANHFHDVCYLPGLEIRTRSDGQQLHVITLSTGVGSVRCLHWVTGKPADIEPDQLRYHLGDHLGSIALELDRDGAVISLEFYYAYGGTCWCAGRSAVEADYKTLRYSGKEMDVSGLYYYGARYYAPWLQRWVSADPGGDVDGLNLYAMVGNNPLLYVDKTGGQKEEAYIYSYSMFISTLAADAEQTLGQIDNIINQSGIGKALLKNTVGEGISAAAGFFGGFYGSEAVGALLPNAGVNIDPFAVGFIGGNAGGDLAGDSLAPIASPFRLVGPLIPQTSSMTIDEIDRRAGLAVSSDSSISIESGVSFFFNRVVGSVVPGVSAMLALGSRVQEAEDIKNGLDPVKIDKIENMLIDWKTTVKQRSNNAGPLLKQDLTH